MIECKTKRYGFYKYQVIFTRQWPRGSTNELPIDSLSELNDSLSKWVDDSVTGLTNYLMDVDRFKRGLAWINENKIDCKADDNKLTLRFKYDTDRTAFLLMMQ